MSRAFVKEGDSTASGSLVDRFYQGLLALSDPARVLVAKRQEQAWLATQPAIEAARREALSALGPDSYREMFESAAERAGDIPQSPTWWAAGDAATALAARRRLTSDQFAVLVGPLGVALPWLKDAATSQS
jgi:NADPH-dependent ferric siderophore reductase